MPDHLPIDSIIYDVVNSHIPSHTSQFLSTISMPIINLPLNNHSMVTRSKRGIHKSKAYMSTIVDRRKNLPL